ncbi:MAG: hypothetical protein H6624_09525 [Bdellovibrionaceae bacterium]|nr:hypothetical protein [Pseudobdellovibrionaceae bacterium]
MKLLSEFSWKSVCLLVATSFLVVPNTWAEEGDQGLHCPYEFDRHLDHCGKRHPDGSFTPSFKLSTSNVVHYNENYSDLSGYGYGWDQVQFPDPIEWDRFGGRSVGGEVGSVDSGNCQFGMPCPNGADNQKAAPIAAPMPAARPVGDPAAGDPAAPGTGAATASCVNDVRQAGAASPLCDADGKPTCYPEGNTALQQSGIPKCGADGRPETSQARNPDEQQPGQQQVGEGPPAGFPQEAEVNSDRDYCEDSQNKARICCNDPIQCVSGLSGPSAGSVAAVGSLAMGALGVYAMSGNGNDPDGIAKNCELMKKLGMGGAVANTALGAKCFTEKGSCEDRCGKVENKYKQVLRDCDQLDTVWRANNGQGQRCPASWKGNYQSVLATANGRRERCTSYNANVAAMGQQAVQSAAASKFAEMCEKAATAQNTGFPDIDQQPVFNGDCNDPVNASNPICVKCRGPAAQYDPLCRGLNGGQQVNRGSGSGFSQADFGTRKVDGSDLNVPTVDAQKQNAVFGDGMGSAARANAVPQNGGGFTGGSGGGGGGFPFGGDGGQGGGQGGGYDTDILKGVGGGGGYSVSGVPVDSRGGYRGPSSLGGGKRDANPFNKFNLKKYLPGGEKDPKRRGLAGLNTGKSEIGQPHEDIFQRVSNRVKVLCKMKRLYDCK